ncbi:SRPBCC domain-containing protein [Microbacterium sp. CFBP9034]|uniref:SRPBCC domain-containing protein n=1 Tax=Microbacterium sp. CFBP9034 TaxID=3096540 RepID=UPI002A69F9A8|nr:SRPBCC domain-containing protein [Microbacterium sp. CFBP9034]MDY0910445.1 SRPBCC domain-containing protein [Microbacterium sp. CFBP9034]
MTVNPSSVVDDAAFSVRRTIRIAAPVEKVWSAVTEPAHISRWFGQAAFAGTDAGARGTLTWPGRDPIPVRIEAIDALRTVSYRWGNDDASGVVPDELDDAHSTVFTFTLVAVPGGTELTVVETGFETTSDPAANLADHRQGWNGELDKLVALLESDS